MPVELTACVSRTAYGLCGEAEAEAASPEAASLEAGRGFSGRLGLASDVPTASP